MSATLELNILTRDELESEDITWSLPRVNHAIGAKTISWDSELRMSCSVERIVPTYSEFPDNAVRWLFDHWRFWADEMTNQRENVLVNAASSRQFRLRGVEYKGFPPQWQIVSSSIVEEAIHADPKEAFWQLCVAQFREEGSHLVVKSAVEFDNDGFSWSVKVLMPRVQLRQFNDRLVEEYHPKAVNRLELSEASLARLYEQVGYP